MAKTTKSSSFTKGTVFGLIIGVLVTGVGFKYGNNLKTSLFTSNKQIYSVHEHIQSLEEAEKVVAGMKNAGVKHTVLVGSPRETIYFDGKPGFTDYDINNLEILKIVLQYPEQFSAFCAINPADSDKLSKLQDCVKRGASGVKLYSGHRNYYSPDHPLNEDGMKEVYSYLQDNKIPVIFHVNLSSYQEEFEKVLQAYPKMTVICPYWCLSSRDLGKLEKFFTTYPNLYISIAFGYKDYVLEGFQRISDNVDAFREFVTKHADRIFFGTGAVFTSYEGKDIDWIASSYEAYRGLLEKDEFQLFFNPDPEAKYKGLHLGEDVLDKIYSKNWEQLMAGK